MTGLAPLFVLILDFRCFCEVRLNHRHVTAQHIVLCAGCRANQISGQGTGDVITSPLYPRKYRALTVCEWTIRASRSFNKILVELPDLNMEGFSNRKQLIFMSLFKLTVFSSVFFLRICIYDETRFMLVFLNNFF